MDGGTRASTSRAGAPLRVGAGARPKRISEMCAKYRHVPGQLARNGSADELLSCTASDAPRESARPSFTRPSIPMSNIELGLQPVDSSPSGSETREKSSYSIGTAELRQDQMGKPVGEEIHAIGPAYHPEDELYKGTEGEKGRVVPKNVYTGAMIQYLVVSKSRLCHVLLKFALPISLTLVVQVTLAYYLWRGVGEADGDLAADCASTDLYLQLAALTAFVCFAMRDALDLLDVHLWLAMFPENGPPDRPLREDGSPWNGRLKFRDYQNQNDRKLVRPETTIQRRARITFYLVFLLPWFLVTSFTTLAGSGALLRSENRFDLVLNTVAACFVLQLPASMYSLLVPRPVRMITEAIPPLNVGRKEGGQCVSLCRELSHICYAFIIIIAIVAIDVPMYYVWCGLDDLHTVGLLDRNGTEAAPLPGAIVLNATQ